VGSQPGSVFFVFLVEPCDGTTHVRTKLRSVSSAWGVGVRTLLVGGGGFTWGNALGTHLLAQGSVGLASSRRIRSSHLFRPEGCLDVLPTKTPGFLHQSRWKSSVFVAYTVFVFCALFSYRYLLVSRQSICILSFVFPCHRFLTASRE